MERAAEAFRAGRPAGCVRQLHAVRRRARSLADEPAVLAVVARTYLSEAAPQFDMTGDLTAALALLDRAEQLGRRVGSAALTAKAAGQRALILLRSGNHQQALALFDIAASLHPDSAPGDRARTLVNRAVAHLDQGDLARAGADLQRAVEYADLAGDIRLSAMARHNLGYVDFLAGRIPSALEAYEEAARTFPGGAHPAMLLDHARALREAGLVRDADEILARSAVELREQRLFQDLAETELVRAECALAEDHPRQARALAASAQRRFARRGNERWLRRADLLLLRCEWAALEERDDRGVRRGLLSVAARAADLGTTCRAEGRPDLARLADLLADECRLRAGAGVLHPPRVRPADALTTRLLVRKVRALAAGAAGDAAVARAEVRRGLSELESYQSSLGSLDLRTASAIHSVALAQVGLAVSRDRGTPADVLATVEQSRAISTRLPQVRPPADEVTARLVGQLRQAEEEARALEGDPAAVEEAARLRSRIAALQRDVRARAWQQEGQVARPPAPPRAAQVRAAARARGCAFVSYARHRGSWLAVVVRPRGTELVDLAATAEVADLVRRVRADLDALALPQLVSPIATAVRASLDSCLRRLDELLLRPLRLDGESVVLSCSGPLSVLPWSLLPSRSGLPTVVTPAAATWLRTSNNLGRATRPRVAAVAGPGLHRAEDEAAEISRIWGSALLVGEEATTAAARSALAASDLLHVAAHGQHRADSPLFSSLRLADGPLYAYELDAEAGIAACVTLSACEAGLATLRPGDEGLGLTHVLLHLGSRSVIAGVARVRDDVAAETMTRVHTGMAAGADSATALADALAAGDEPAPFVVFGGSW